MEFIRNLLSEGYFALFFIIATAYVLGRIKIKGVSLDVSAVIFVALVMGHFGVSIPPIVQDIGLVLFIFTIGIQAGPGFFDALEKHGIKLAVLALLLILTASGIAVAAHYLTGYDMGIMAGLLAGALSSASALASATEMFGEVVSIGYSIAYPFGVVGVILIMRLLPKLLIDNIEEAEKDWEKESAADHPALLQEHIQITNDNVEGKTPAELSFRQMTGAIISRVMHRGEAFTPMHDTKLYTGDLVQVVGTEDALKRARMLLGKKTEKEIPLSGRYDVQTVLVTNKKVVSKTLAELNLQAVYDATVVRIRRSGIDITPTPGSRIRFGDKLVVASSKENMKMVFELFGNDDRRLSDTDILPIALGIVIGVVVGKFTFLGLTGGVLLVALLLSKLGKTGPVLWTMSGSANVLLRELGLVFFLSVVGTNAGATLVDTFSQYGLTLFFVGVTITIMPMVVLVLVGKYVYRLNVLALLGALAGSMTSTPGLATLTPITRSNAPQVAYATAYPIAMVLLVVIVKLLGVF